MNGYFPNKHLFFDFSQQWVVTPFTAQPGTTGHHRAPHIPSPPVGFCCKLHLRSCLVPWRAPLHWGMERYWNHQPLPSGELTKSYGKIHHAIHGKIHYFNGHFPLLCKRSPEGIENGSDNLMFAKSSTRLWLDWLDAHEVWTRVTRREAAILCRYEWCKSQIPKAAWWLGQISRKSDV